MDCCNNNKNINIIDSRKAKYYGIDVTRRRRICNECNNRWTTYEFSRNDLKEIDKILKMLRLLDMVNNNYMEDIDDYVEKMNEFQTLSAKMFNKLSNLGIL